MILQTYIFVVKTILASGPICREIEKQKAKKEVEKWLAQGKMSEAKNWLGNMVYLKNDYLAIVVFI